MRVGPKDVAVVAREDVGAVRSLTALARQRHVEVVAHEDVGAAGKQRAADRPSPKRRRTVQRRSARPVTA